jgi:hypothetical protein
MNLFAVIFQPTYSEYPPLKVGTLFSASSASDFEARVLSPFPGEPLSTASDDAAFETF